MLVFEPNVERRKQLVECIEGKEVQVETAADVEGAISILRREPVDCVVAGDASAEFAEALSEFADSSPIEFGRLNVVACEIVNSRIMRGLDSRMRAPSVTPGHWIESST